MARAELDKRPGDVAAMFDAIAGRYDLLNDILSAGQVRLWRRAVARITGARPGERVLDLAAGTGTSSLTFTATGADCVVCEFSTITIAPVDRLYRRYLINVLPAIARRTARSPEAYEYLAESIADWPPQRELAGLIEAAGWSAARWRDLNLGVVAVHVARRG